jgi:hypothetical protein
MPMARLMSLDLVKWAESLRDDPTILAAVEEGDTSPVDILQAGLDDLISRMNPDVSALNKMMEESGGYAARKRYLVMLTCV